MKIALVGVYPVDHAKICGGVEAAVYYLSKGLRCIDSTELHVIAITKQIAHSKVVEEDNIIVHYLAVPSKRIVPNLITNIGRARRILNQIQPDIVHGESAVGTLAGVQAGYPTVHTIHGVIHRELQLARTFGQRLNMRLHAYLSKRAVAAANHIIAVTPYAQQQYEDIARAEISIIPNAVEDNYFHLKNKESGKMLLTVGYICPRKNTFGLVKAFRIIKDHDAEAELVVVGGITDEMYYKEIIEYISKNSLIDSVHFLGFINQDHLEDEFARASIICMFSDEESFSLVVAQGMAAGKPVVSTDSGGPSDLIVDGETGFLVKKRDEQAFANKCIALLSNADQRYKMGDRARLSAKARFSKESVASQTMAVYQKVLNIRKN